MGGARAGITTAVLSAISVQYLLLPRPDAVTVFASTHGVATTVFLVAALIGSAIAEERRQVLARTKARERDRDVTERAEAATHATRYREWLDALVADVPAVVWEAWGEPDESAQRIDYVNHHVEQMLGYSVNEWLSTPNFWLAIVHPEDRDRAAREAREIFEGGRGGTSRFRWVTRSGDTVWVEGKSRVILDAVGHPAGMRGVTVDISDLIRLEAERTELLRRTELARSEAEQANRLKDEFLMTLSHELRTPLNAIWGWTRILRTLHGDEQRTARGLEVIERNARAQLRLIEDLLDVSRIVAGKLRMDLQPTDLETIVAGVIDSAKPAAEAKEVAIIATSAEASSVVRADPGRLQQAIWNLVSNAVKFTPAGGRVTIGIVPGRGHIEVTVSDTGAGIDPAVLPLIFERFRQADSGTARTHSGLGLGLAISRSLVEAHGGTLTATSDGIGRGATFVIRLPVSAGLARPKRPSDVVAALASTGRRLDGLRVLVIEDNPDARELLAAILADVGAVVQSVTSAAEGFAAMTTFEPTVVVSDIEMADEDGLDLIRRIRRAGGPLARVHAVAVSAHVSAGDRARALEAGYDAHVTKPIDPEALRGAVAMLLAGS
jgi:PAS domain S-box-containing protein